MSAPQVPVKKLWPRYAVSPAGDRARFDCPGDVMPGWTLEVPLPEPVEPMKRGPGRPRKDAA